MKPVFVALLHNLSITEDLGVGDKINETLRITNNRDVIANLLRSAHRKIMGEMEVAALLTGAPVLFAEAPIRSDMSPHQYLHSRLHEIQSFLMTTWLFQDNAINCELGFVLYANGPVETATSNFLAHLYSTARCEMPHTSLSREQLREMRKLHREALSPPDHPFDRPVSQLTSTQPRVTRAIYLVNAARGAPDIGMKVAHYCTGFETLFATSQAELAHQLSERVACYLHQSPEDRLTAYHCVKAAYALRSKVVHGSTLRKEKLDDALATSESCDTVARQLLRRILTDAESQRLFERNSEAFEEAMLKLIFARSAGDHTTESSSRSK